MDKFAIPRKNIFIILAGLAIMILGYILMTGGGSNDPEVFSYGIFSTRRLTIAPLLILAGFAIEIIGIMHKSKKTE